MPSRSQSRSDCLSSGDTMYGIELKRSSKHHSKSKAVKDKALSPRASLKTRDKIKADTPIRPPHADLPFEFVKSGESGIFVQTRAGGNQHRQQAGKNENKEGELIKHMSSLPGFLQRGEKPQDKILNFGVLDWDRLEKWKHKGIPSSGRSRQGRANTSASSSESTKVSSTSSYTVKREEICYSEKVDHCPGFLPDGLKETGCNDFTTIEELCFNEKQGKTRKDKLCVGATSDRNTYKTKGRGSKQKESLETGMLSSKLSAHNKVNSKENVSNDTAKKVMEKCNGLEFDPAYQHRHKKQDSIILLLPKDFSGSGCPEESQEICYDGNSGEVNWSSFSDVFSVGELKFEELTSDVPHSCPLPSSSMADTESELDINLDKLIHDQRMQLPSQGNMSACFNHKFRPSHDADDETKKKEFTSSTTSNASEAFPDEKTSHVKFSNARVPSPTRQFSFGIGRLSKSLSFKEGATLPQLRHASIRSGPVEALNSDDSSIDKTGRVRISPFRRLLDPLLKPKAFKPNLSHTSLPYAENSKELNVKANEKSGSTINNAVIQLTTKSGLPLFKFVVESNNEILASTVKKVSTFEKDDPIWVYCFYSVQEVKRKSSSWIYQGNKGKIPDYSYNVVGKMKVSKPNLSCDDEDKIRRESVLYGVDLRKVDEAGLESVVNRELGAIVFEVPKEVYNDDEKKYGANDTSESMKPGSIVVILPGGVVHSLPSEGVPASLIDRWRSGGLCDCGGWDVGCKLQILTNQDEDEKLFQKKLCNLFQEGNGEQKKPIFSLMEHGEGVYSVEYNNSVVSSLQAFAISVAVLNDQKQASLSVANSYSEGRKWHYRSKSSIVQGEGTRYATYPPHSPVSRA